MTNNRFTTANMKIFVGYDSTQDIAHKVCEYSIHKHQKDIEVIPLKQSELRKNGEYYRELDPLSSTEFSFTRFLVPHIMNYKGWCVFCDCDFVWLEDINNLFSLRDDKYAVMVVKHNYHPKKLIKMGNKIQSSYPRKNWSSLVLWNCSHPSNQKLTVEKVNTETGSYLHQFQWLKDEEIGELPVEWNWLSGWNSGAVPKAIHYTEGGPWLKGYEDCEYSYVWNEYHREYFLFKTNQ